MIKVASFLSLTEVESVKNELKGRRIEYFVSSKGTAPGRYHDPFYQVSVNVTDYFVARRLLPGQLLEVSLKAGNVLNVKV